MNASPGAARGVARLLAALACCTDLAAQDRTAAGEGQMPAEIVAQDERQGGLAALPAAWWSAETATGDWGGRRGALVGRGVDVFGGLTTEVWGNLTGGLGPGAVSTGFFDFGVELDLERLAGWPGATIRNSWFAPMGQDISAEYVGNIFTVSNAAAFNSLFLYELWFQQEFLEGAISLRLGQLAADTEFAASEYGSLFLNATFGWPSFLANNIPNVGPAYPKGAPGVRLALQPAGWLTVRTAVYQGDAFADASNRHGVRWDLQRQSGYLWMGELQAQWSNGAKSKGAPGTARAGCWIHSGDFAAADPSSGTVHPGNGGIYAVVDQRVWQPEGGRDSDRGVGWFGRIAAGAPDRSFLGFYFDSGVTCKGLVPARADDTFGVAFGFGRPTDGARRALEADGGTPAAAEMVLEATYQCQLNPWLSVQPDVQFVINPGATTDHRNALVAGARVSVVF